ncbi:hypothetical protein M2475_000392 [Breznakia sp. PF5-3]|uniref:hypothetical protein n=1 Tax=unclassified Breznakia TaxID=2623764 RepID=UPI0024059EDE|nr:MULTISPECIES: hypothetical protein [unclassified Breznakia]MDF9824094.1 hypothetical protein [Breznakia sp. PM6-1]MDF9834840.1 hypothetical protein [Breznakia sp. PF5-3]MDF9837138.1 hypothetical protein [Breznakia sp. PFB2-8]MDF9859063.1 hypothetical protein [Breznakia sp. PH5-24]
MKKLLGISVAVIAASGIAIAVAAKMEKDKIKRELQEKKPDELIKILNDAATVLELKEIADMDESTKEKFEKAKATLIAKSDKKDKE